MIDKTQGYRSRCNPDYVSPRAARIDDADRVLRQPCQTLKSIGSRRCRVRPLDVALDVLLLLVAFALGALYGGM